MNMTKIEPVKDANLPNTSQSLMPQENTNICELMDLIESDGFSSEKVEGMDFNCAAEFESLFQSLVEETGAINRQKIPPCQDTGLLPVSDLNLNNGLAADSDFNLNSRLPTDSDARLNTGLSVDSHLKLNYGLSTENDLKKMQNELSTDNKLKTLNTGSSADSFTSGAERKAVKDVKMDVQLKPSSSDTEENKDNILAVTESCAKYAETNSYSKVTADRHEVAPTSNESQELAVTSLYDVSKHTGSTSPGQLVLTRSPSHATVTVQALDIPQDSGGLETVATATCDDPGTADGEIVSVQAVTKGKVEINSSNLMPCELPSAEVSHSIMKGDNIFAENRTGVISAEVGTPNLYTARDTEDHLCANIRDHNDVSALPKLLSVDETSSLMVADKVLSEKSVSDGIAEGGTPVLIACKVREVIDHSYFKVRGENETAVIDHSFASKNSVPVMINIQDMIPPLSVPDSGTLTVNVSSVSLDDTHVAENVTVSSHVNVSMPFGTEIKETVVRRFNLETKLPTENTFPTTNSIAETSQQNIITHAGAGVTVTDSNQAVASGVPIMLEKLTLEGSSCTLQTDCTPDIAAERADLKSDNIHMAKYTDTTVVDTNGLERLPVTTKARQIVTSRSNNTGMGCAQFPVGGSGLQQKETGSFRSSARCEGINIKSMLELDGHQYSCSPYMKNEGGLADSQRERAESNNVLVADSKNLVFPHTVKIGENSDVCIVTCRENVPLSNLSKLSGKEVSALYVNSHILPTYPPHHQNLNSAQSPSDSSAAVSQKGAKHHMTAPKAEQNKTNDISTSSPFPNPNGVKLRNMQQRKQNTKEANISKISSCLKSHLAFPGRNKDKFSGFIFEKHVVPEENLRPYSKKKISKIQRLRKGRKIHLDKNELSLTLTNNPHPDPLNCNSYSTHSSNEVTLFGDHGSIEDIKVENTNVLNHTYVKNESDNDSLDWIQQLLM